MYANIITTPRNKGGQAVLSACVLVIFLRSSYILWCTSDSMSHVFGSSSDSLRRFRSSPLRVTR